VTFKENGGTYTDEVLNYLQKKGHKNVELTSTTPTIEDCFIKMAVN
jgi:hypothetical protein